MWFEADADRRDSLRESQQEYQRQPRHPVRCARCSNTVSEKQFVTAVQGAHQHVKTNPQGHTFTILCYAEAPGAEAWGRAQTEHSWFSDCAWQFAHCRQCHTQLGWYFTGASRFYAFINDHILIQ